MSDPIQPVQPVGATVLSFDEFTEEERNDAIMFVSRLRKDGKVEEGTKSPDPTKLVVDDNILSREDLEKSVDPIAGIILAMANAKAETAAKASPAERAKTKTTDEDDDVAEPAAVHPPEPAPPEPAASEASGAAKFEDWTVPPPAPTVSASAEPARSPDEVAARSGGLQVGTPAPRNKKKRNAAPEPPTGPTLAPPVERAAEPTAAAAVPEPPAVSKEPTLPPEDGISAPMLPPTPAPAQPRRDVPAAPGPEPLSLPMPRPQRPAAKEPPKANDKPPPNPVFDKNAPEEVPESPTNRGDGSSGGKGPGGTPLAKKKEPAVPPADPSATGQLKNDPNQPANPAGKKEKTMTAAAINKKSSWGKPALAVGLSLLGGLIMLVIMVISVDVILPALLNQAPTETLLVPGTPPPVVDGPVDTPPPVVTPPAPPVAAPTLTVSGSYVTGEGETCVTGTLSGVTITKAGTEVLAVCGKGVSLQPNNVIGRAGITPVSVAEILGALNTTKNLVDDGGAIAGGATVWCDASGGPVNGQPPCTHK